MKFCIYAGCDYRGKINETRGKCICKDLVQGESCNVCVENHWNLKRDNPKGCQRKFQFCLTFVSRYTDSP